MRFYFLFLHSLLAEQFAWDMFCFD